MPFTIGLTPPIKRSDLEYPTEDVTFAYLAAINKVSSYESNDVKWYFVLTNDEFTDKAVEGYGEMEYEGLIARYVDKGNYYFGNYTPAVSTADVKLYKRVGGSGTELGSEAVDIGDDDVYLNKLSCSGSSIKLFRVDMATPKIDVTDTDLANGKYGCSPVYWTYTRFTIGVVYLRPPASHVPKALAIIEAEIVGSGTFEDPYRPDLARQLDEHPQYGKIDKLAVTWGAFDYKKEHAVMLIMITGDNPYQAGAIDKQKEHASKKGLKVLSPPRDYFEAIEQYRKLKADYPNWLAGKDNYAYQALGHEALECFQVADFYYGELIEHKTHYSQLKRVPDWEMDRTLNRWRDRLQKVDVLHEERDKHVKKLTEVLKKGW